MGKEKIPYDKRPRNIAPELLESWKKMRKPSDARELVKYTGRSLPLIYAALNNGYVSTPALAEKITRFYLERDKALPVSEQARELINDVADNAPDDSHAE